MTEEQKNKIFAILKKNEFGVVATLPNEIGKAPQSAVVAISETPDLHIIFGSFNSSRKNNNIKYNPHISVVVGWDNKDKKTLQIEGKAQLVLDNKEQELLEEMHCVKNPSSERFRNDPRQEYFRMVPYWIRYSDFSKDPQEVWEIII